MVRNLQRIYLYLMCIGLLTFVAYACFTLLNFIFDPSARSSPITGLDPLTFAVSLLVVALILLLGVGGLHYWGIQRDMAVDDEAASGSVRAILLNLVQGIAGACALFAGFLTFQQAGSPVSHYAAFLAAMLVAVGGFALLQLERDRTRPAAGVPIGAQRTHMSIMLVIALLTLLVAWMVAAMPLFGGNAVDPGNWLGLAWVAAFLVFYIWLARGDTSSLRRLSALLVSFELGLILTAVGIWGTADWLLRGVWGISTDADPAAIQPATFVPLLIFGLIVLAGYTLWLLREASQIRLGREGTRLTLVALSAFTLGIPFYVAVILLLQYPLLKRGPAAATFALGLLVAGALHPVLFLRLRQRSRNKQWTIPFEAYDLFALLGGALITLVAVAFTILSLVVRGAGAAGKLGKAKDAFIKAIGPDSVCKPTATVVCHSQPQLPSILPLLVIVAVGLWIVGLHALFARTQGFLPSLPGSGLLHHHGRDEEISSAIESVVKNVAAGDMTQEQAVEHLRKLMQT